MHRRCHSLKARPRTVAFALATLAVLVTAGAEAGNRNGNGQGNRNALRPPTITAAPGNPTIETSAVFGFSSASASATGYVCRLDGAAYAACSSPRSYSGLAPGLHVFEVHATDARGRLSGVASYSWSIERPPAVTPATPSIDSGPASSTTATSATLVFNTATADVTFACRLDGSSFARCASPVSYSGLTTGSHVFSVKAISATGVESGTASWSWTITTDPATAPATPSIDSGPADPTSSADARLAFSSTQTGVSFACKLDGGAFQPCTSPVTYTGLADGEHSFGVQARTASGLASGTASLSWSVDTVGPSSSLSLSQASPLSGTVDVAASAADSSGVAKVEFRVDGTLAATSTVAPHVMRWDTRTVTDGQHVLSAVAYDIAGNAGRAAATEVAVLNQPPTCSGLGISPGQSIQAAVNGSPEGTVFCLRAGVHRLVEGIVPKPGNVFLGEPGAVVSGAKVITGQFVASEGRWVASGQSQRNPNRTGQCQGGGSACTYPDDVFFDDRPLRRVLSLAELVPGAFFFDYAQQRVWIADDPAGHRVEAAVATRAFKGWGSGAVGVTVAGLVIEKFANEAQTGAIQATDRWTIRDNEVRLNHGIGIQGGDTVTNNKVHHNGQLGMGAYGTTGAVIAGNEIAYNNYANYDQFWEAGGTKFVRTVGLIVRNNYVHHNGSAGLWTDWDNMTTLYEGNVVEDNVGAGIGHEASYDAVIRNNVVRRNGFGHTGGIDGGGIVLNTSSNVEIYGNTVDRNLQGIGISSGDRGSGIYGVHATRNVYVHHNTIRMVARAATGLASNNLADYTTNNNRFDHNAYTLCSPAYFAWQNPNGSTNYAYISKDQWVAAGNDRSATFTSSC